MRLIDADYLADSLFEKRKNYPQWVADVIGNMPEAIVRCKNCKYWHECENNKGYGDCGQANGITLKPADWFCADGVKKR